MTYELLFREFTSSRDTMRIYAGGSLIFSSRKKRLLPLLEYIGTPRNTRPLAVVFDEITGQAAALLAIKAGGRELYSPLGSRLAAATLESYGVRYHFDTTVPFITGNNGQDICPMEKLSLDKDPETFYHTVKRLINRQKGNNASGQP